MKHRTLAIALCLAAGCTYNTYKTYNDAPIAAGDEDAGVHEAVAAAGGGGDGGSAGTGGQGGSSLGEAGSSALPSSDCAGCVRLAILSGRTAEYQLEFDSRRNLASSLVRWRLRVRDYVGDVQVVAYVESGDHLGPEQGFAAEGTSTFVSLNAAAGWQDVGIDLVSAPSFRPPTFVDAGGSAGGTFDNGNPFDKTRVERVGLRITPFSQSGLFTPATVELDSVTFTGQPSLDGDFSSDQGGFELLDPDTATVTFVGTEGIQ